MIPVSYVTCTRNRLAELAETIRLLDALHAQAPEEAEFVIADNGSDVPVAANLPATRIAVRVVTLPENMAAAGRNHAAAVARHDWLIMLDDDSAPKDLGYLHTLARLEPDVAVLMADITLPDGSRERGGLPEVFVGCGAAIRKHAFLDAGGYDPEVFFAAEEPDLCARLISAGWRAEFSPWFRVLHRKTSTNRDMNRMLRLLTRNQGMIIERTTPDAYRSLLRKDHIRRCAWIAAREDAREGFAQGLSELRARRSTMRRRPMTLEHFERFTGLSHARQAVDQALDNEPFATACLTHEGKHAWAVRQALSDAGVEIIRSPMHAERLVIATMSPGPMLDALVELASIGMGYRTLAPWLPARCFAGLDSAAIPLMPNLIEPAPSPAAPAAALVRSKIRA